MLTQVSSWPFGEDSFRSLGLFSLTVCGKNLVMRMEIRRYKCKRAVCDTW